MNIDIRLKLDFFEHPKARKLRRRLGAEGVLCLLRLWLWAAANRPEGILRGLDADDLELAAQWEGRPGELVAALCEFRLLEAPPASPFFCGESAPGGPGAAGSNPAAPDCTAGQNAFRIHDWAEHQAWACRSEERTRSAKRAAQARWGLENNVENHQDADVACGNMRPASKRNAPRAKNQEPEAKAKAMPETPRVKAAAPAVRSESGQGRGESAPCEPAAKPESRKASARSGLSLRAESPAQGIAASPAPAGQAGKGDASRQDAAPASLPARGEGGAFPPESGQGRAGAEPELVAEIVPEPALAPSPRLAFSGFTPPSFAEVELYCGQRGNGIDPRRFLDWCEARRWKVGGQTIRDWRALIRRWEKREREEAPRKALHCADFRGGLPPSGAPPGERGGPSVRGEAAFAPACRLPAGLALGPAPAPELPAHGMQAARPFPARALP